MSGWIGGLLQGLGSVAGGLFNFFGQKETNKSQEGINQTQIDLQREAWAREDNAVQRRMKDLEAAGLSPTLAAGSAAASSGPSVKLGKMESPLSHLGNPTEAIAAIRQLNMQEKMNNEELKLKKEQVKTEQATNRNINEKTRGEAIQNTYLNDWLTMRNFEQGIVNNYLEDFYKNRNLMFAEQYGGAVKQNMMLDLDLASQRQYATFLHDNVMRDQKYQNALLKELEYSLKHDKISDAVAITNTLVNAIGTMGGLYNYGQRNNIIRDNNTMNWYFNEQKLKNKGR